MQYNKEYQLFQICHIAAHKTFVYALQLMVPNKFSCAFRGGQEKLVAYRKTVYPLEKVNKSF
jgi:hypothetical protein